MMPNNYFDRITTARRNVIGSDATASSEQEDAIWRQLIHELPAKGIKRKEPSSRVPAVDVESESDEEPTPSKRGNRSKKAKISAGKSTGKTPLSKMTKAEVSEAITVNA
jgi:hypothetical protein